MGCYRPISVPVTPKGTNASYPLDVGCGNCLGCRSDQARQWAIRLVHEAQIEPEAYFVTLTYSDEKLPHNGSLEPCHLKDFWKRLRDTYRAHLEPLFPNRRIRYFACGEYGDRTDRPHYHAVLYGFPLLDRSHHRGPDHAPAYRSGLLDGLWKHGLTEASPVTFASAAYVAGYIKKKQSKTKNPDHYLRYDENGELHEIQQEFSRCSTRPAIGLEWLKRYWSDVYPRDEVVVEGRTSKPPRYYDRVMVDPHPEDPSEPRHVLPGITFLERQELMLEVKMKRIEEMQDPSPQTLDNRRKNHEARNRLYSQRNKV